MLVRKAPVDTVSHAKWKYGGKRKTSFIFCLGTSYDISSMESIGNYSIVLLDRKSMPPKMFLSLSFSLWALAPLQIPTSLCEGPFFYFSMDWELPMMYLAWKAPVDTASMDCERMMEKGINFIFCLGTAYDVSSMESVGMPQVIFIGRKSMPPKNNFISQFKLWALAPVQITTSLREGPFFYFMEFLFLIWVSIFS